MPQLVTIAHRLARKRAHDPLKQNRKYPNSSQPNVAQESSGEALVAYYRDVRPPGPRLSARRPIHLVGSYVR